MINSLINNSVSFMIQKGAIPDTQEQREIYRYGLELNIYYIIHATMLLAIGLLFGQVLEVALLLILFGMIQSNGGGYHANTHGRCLLFMAFGTLTFLVLLPIYQSATLLQASSVIFGLAIVIWLAPVAHRNHPLSQKRSKILGKRAKQLACAISFTWLILMVFDIGAFFHSIISITMLYSGISMISAHVKMKRKTLSQT